MATAKQMEANRTNAKKSTGPRTKSGKSRAAINARRHNLTGQVSLMPAEDLAAHDAFCHELVESLHPATPMERQLAQSIASDQWRLNRMRAIEDNLLSLGYFTGASTLDTNHPEIKAAAVAAQVFAQDPRQFQLLSLYIQRTSREIHRNMELLRRLQTERQATRTAALHEATRFKSFCEQQGVAYTPATFADYHAEIKGAKPQIGFDFSTEQIDTFALHQRLTKPPASLRLDLRNLETQAA